MVTVTIIRSPVTARQRMMAVQQSTTTIVLGLFGCFGASSVDDRFVGAMLSFDYILCQERHAELVTRADAGTYRFKK